MLLIYPLPNIFNMRRRYRLETAACAVQGCLDLMQALKDQGFGYKELMIRLNEVGEVNSSQFIIRLMEAGLLEGYDKAGNKVLVQDRLRFDGVGVEYEV